MSLVVFTTCYDTMPYIYVRSKADATAQKRKMRKNRFRSRRKGEIGRCCRRRGPI